MLIDGSHATIGKVDVNQIRENGSDVYTISEYEDTISNNVVDLVGRIGFEHSNNKWRLND
jgi:hypothetical protein